VRPEFRTGMAAGMPFAIASAVLAVSFGVVAREAGFSAVATIVMSMIVYAGSAQFAAVGILSAGGSPAAAIAAGALTNSRFLPMGIAFGPSLPGGPLRRALEGQPVVDTSWAMALRPDGTFDRFFLFGHSSVQYVGWSLGTALGVLGGSLIGDPHDYGLDAIFPAFFVAVLVGELRDRQGIAAALGGAAIALALVSFTPAGIPVLAASLAALAGLHPRMARAT
jgi:4-azaleucine resistance transporter AzlC